jgi:hypothetical protein
MYAIERFSCCELMLWYWTGHGYVKFHVLGGITVTLDAAVAKSVSTSGVKRMLSTFTVSRGRAALTVSGREARCSYTKFKYPCSRVPGMLYDNNLYNRIPDASLPFVRSRLNLPQMYGQVLDPRRLSSNDGRRQHARRTTL